MYPCDSPWPCGTQLPAGMGTGLARRASWSSSPLTPPGVAFGLRGKRAVAWPPHLQLTSVGVERQDTLVPPKEVPTHVHIMGESVHH